VRQVFPKRINREARPNQGAADPTNRLIDRVVYRLYGLTEQEMAVVEGKQ
jgi:hypothetical protein